MMKKKVFAAIAACAMIGGLFAGCSSEGTDSNGSKTGENTVIQMSGSTSMEELAKAFAEDYMAKENVTIDVQLGGSSVGVKNVQDGVSQIGNVSRALKDSETGLKANTVAIDSISVIVNKNNQVENLTKDQITKIFTGEITNWKEVGGKDAPIAVIGREAGSGTRDAFEEIFGIKDKAKYGQELTETGIVATTVSTTEGAIGYISYAYLNDTVKGLKVDGVACSVETVKDGSYPVQRPFLMVTKETVSEPVQKFIDYVLSADGQAIVEQLNLITVE